jgi:carbamate kinase
VVDLLAAGFRLALLRGGGRSASRDAGAIQGTAGHALVAAMDRACRARGVPAVAIAVLTRVLVEVAVAGAARRPRPAPRLLRVLEAEAVDHLLAAGAVPVLGGAGTVLVTHGEREPRGVAGSVDADLVAETLATAVRADRLLLLTGVEQVAVGFGTARAIAVERLTVAEARLLLAAGEFPLRSMGVKIEAAVRFVEAGGREALVTTPARAGDALGGRAGTRVVP